MKTIQSKAQLIILLFLLFTTVGFTQNSFITLKIRAAKQGDIKGDMINKGMEGLIAVNGLTHEIVSPRDVSTGQASGKRQHRPIVVEKTIDRASPLLYSALATNEILPEVILSFYRQSRTGMTELFYSIKLTDASISSCKTVAEDGKMNEIVSFVYKKITWTYSQGNITSEDSWGASN